MDKHIIRENAGKLWRLLSTDVHRKWNLQEVKELTGFNDLEVASAIGWLARKVNGVIIRSVEPEQTFVIDEHKEVRVAFKPYKSPEPEGL